MVKASNDLPVEVVYKYLLRDYRALQKENKELRKMVMDLLRGIVDTDSEEFKAVVEERAAAYHANVRGRLKAENRRLRDEIDKLKKI